MPGLHLIAHRAGNEPALVALAEAAGARTVEVDVHVRAGRLEVRHVKALGPLPVLWDRWYLVPRQAWPTLDDVLAAAAPGTGVLIDLKGPSPRLAPLVRRAVERHARGPVWVCSRTWSHLRGAWGAEVRVLRSIGSGLQLRRHGLLRRPGDGVSIHARLLDARTVAELHRRVPTVIAWGARDEAAARRLAGWGVDGLILDELALLSVLHREAA